MIENFIQARIQQIQFNIVDSFEKGGKPAQLGEIRHFGPEQIPYKKTADGWIPVPHLGEQAAHPVPTAVKKPTRANPNVFRAPAPGVLERKKDRPKSEAALNSLVGKIHADVYLEKKEGYYQVASAIPAIAAALAKAKYSKIGSATCDALDSDQWNKVVHAITDSLPKPGTTADGAVIQGLRAFEETTESVVKDLERTIKRSKEQIIDKTKKEAEQAVAEALAAALPPKEGEPVAPLKAPKPIDLNDRPITVATLTEDIVAATERLVRAKKRQASYQQIAKTYYATGDLTKALGHQEALDPAYRLNSFTYGQIPTGTTDMRVGELGRKVIPDQFFSNIPDLVSVYKTIDKDGTSNHCGGTITIYAKGYTPEDHAHVELHEYLHGFHHESGIWQNLLGKGLPNCPLARAILLDGLRKEWDEMPASRKAGWTREQAISRTHARAEITGGKLITYGPEHPRQVADCADVIAAITAYDPEFYGYGHDKKYFRGLKVTAKGQIVQQDMNSGEPAYFQLCELFVHFGESYFQPNKVLAQTFPKTHALAMAYFDNLFVHD